MHIDPKLDAKALLESELAQNHARRAKEKAVSDSARPKSAQDKLSESTVKLEEAIQDGKLSAISNQIPHSVNNAAPATATEVEEAAPAEQAPSTNPDRALGGVTTAETSSPLLQKLQETAEVPSDTRLSGDDEPPLPNQHPSDPSQPASQPPPPRQEEPQQAEVSIDSMFADAELANNEDVEMNDKPGDLGFDLSNFNQGNLGDASLDSFDFAANAETTSLELLPDLASYANASSGNDGGGGGGAEADADTDFLNLGRAPLPIPTTSATSKPDTESAQPLNLTSQNHHTTTTNFDDLFADGNFGGDASLIDLDLDDSFFQ